MAISDNIQTKSDEVLAEIEAHLANPNAPSPKTTELHDKCLKAILGGGQSQGWIDYMGLFATSPAELARLMPDGTAKDEVRAYLVANGKCMMGTTVSLLDNVTTNLD
ncbi:MAG TPA: hypothetical protein VN643_24840 [Pyrinomonadaceae bacterium]|nr:hypothetical protein [Pyrinomonadaceae bacterium]